MDPSGFLGGERVHLRRLGEGLWAYIPPRIPRAIDLSLDVVNMLGRANHALGELNGTGKHVANPLLLMGPYLRREAVLSSRIEGTQTGLSDLVLVEANGQVDAPPTDDAREVINYVTALEWALKELANLPVSLRLVRELHKRLMAGVRGDDKTPGEFRQFQNFVAPKGTPIERATFVPPPPGPAMRAALDDWERFLHKSDEVPVLVRCALMHYQFETIHPFSDGNGRLGRLLIPLLLLERGAISHPLLYVSAYLERNRDAYYESLTTGRTHGDVIPWVRLFLTAVEAQAIDATRRADLLSELRDKYQDRFQKSKSTILRSLIDMLFQSLAVTVPAVARFFEVTFPTAQAAVEELLAAGILRETTGQKRGRAYLAGEILSIIMPEEAKDRTTDVRENAQVTVVES